MSAIDEFEAMLDREEEAFRRLMTYYQCAIMEVETKLRVFDAEFRLQHDRNPIESVCSRLKSQGSMAEKMARKGFPMSVESIERNLFDVAGVRVVCALPEDAYALAESLVGQDDVALVDRRDYIASPKESGYRSLHVIVEIPSSSNAESAHEGGGAAALHRAELLGGARPPASVQEGPRPRRGGRHRGRTQGSFRRRSRP